MIPVILFNPWSTTVVIVWAIPVADWILVIPTPMFVSLTNLFNVSLVTLFWTSLTTTSPIKSALAKDFVSAGSATGLSLLTWG